MNPLWFIKIIQTNIDLMTRALFFRKFVLEVNPIRRKPKIDFSDFSFSRLSINVFNFKKCVFV